MGINAVPEQRVLAIGVFDLFHVGHLRYLAYARHQGTHLTVAVTSDAIAMSIKEKQPSIAEADRLEIVRAVRYVDSARLLPCSTEYTEEAAAWIAEWGIQHVVAGGMWQGSPRWSRLTPALTRRNISVSFAPATEGISTTRIVETIRQHAPKDMGKP